MKNPTKAFDRITKFIYDTEKFMFSISEIQSQDEFDNLTESYFKKYDYYPDLTKGIVTMVEFKDLLINKQNHLKLILSHLGNLSTHSFKGGHIETDEDFLKFSKKSIIENRMIPMIGVVINEIELCLKSLSDENQNEADQELLEIDYSDSKFNERVIMLHELGVLDFLRGMQPFTSSINSLASVLSGFTGIPGTTVQSYINPIYNKTANQRNNPLKSNKIEVIVQKLIQIGFKRGD